MTIKAQDVELYAGDTLFLNATITGSSGPQNLAGSTINWVLYNTAKVAILTKTTVSGIAITNAPGGLFTVTLSPADTESLTPGSYAHEAEITDSSGNVSTVFVGRLILFYSKA